MTKKRYKSEAFEAIHSTISDMHEIGLVDKETMREFDENCLEHVEDFTPKQIKALRGSMSQPVFAKRLNVSKSTVEKWESGAGHPTGAALKLLNITKKHGTKILK